MSPSSPPKCLRSGPTSRGIPFQVAGRASAPLCNVKPLPHPLGKMKYSHMIGLIFKTKNFHPGVGIYTQKVQVLKQTKNTKICWHGIRLTVCAQWCVNVSFVCCSPNLFVVVIVIFVEFIVAVHDVCFS